MSNECEKCGREKEFTGTVLLSMPSINVMKCRACEPFEFSGSAVAGRTYRSGPHIGGGISDDPIELAKAIRKGPDMSEDFTAQVIPDGYALVPVELLSELRDFAHPEIERYCEIWAGRRDSEFPAMRKIIADADALLAAAPKV